MRPVLLADFGSTYTKLTAIDLENECLLGTASSYTTVQTDVRNGFEDAKAQLEAKTGKLDFEASYACSSAAGGLKMVVSGLVPELTSEAAKIACLGAGAKVVGQFSFQLTQDDLEDIAALEPDIFLLVGGTDGGNTANILHNAEMLASMQPRFPIIIAGNRTAARPCQRLLKDCETYICANVMPKFGVLSVGETQAKIRDIFLARIIQAKGLAQIAPSFSAPMIPTPAAVLQAMKLLADDAREEPGIGDLIAVDVGGATTDVYSITEGMPREMNRVFKGLPEPYAKRTVEGDLGMRYSILSVVEAAGLDRVCRLSGLSEDRAQELLDLLCVQTDLVPKGDRDMEALDFAIASLAVETAVGRHAGKIEETYTMMGQTFVQTGKDLTQVKRIVFTGGSLIHAPRVDEIAAHALLSPLHPESLLPRKAECLLDQSYILAAMGLLSAHEPLAALHIMKKELSSHGHCQSEALQ